VEMGTHPLSLPLSLSSSLPLPLPLPLPLSLSLSSSLPLSLPLSLSLSSSLPLSLSLSLSLPLPLPLSLSLPLPSFEFAVVFVFRLLRNSLLFQFQFFRCLFAFVRCFPSSRFRLFYVGVLRLGVPPLPWVRHTQFRTRANSNATSHGQNYCRKDSNTSHH